MSSGSLRLLPQLLNPVCTGLFVWRRQVQSCPFNRSNRKLMCLFGHCGRDSVHGGAGQVHEALGLSLALGKVVHEHSVRHNEPTWQPVLATVALLCQRSCVREVWRKLLRRESAQHTLHEKASSRRDAKGARHKLVGVVDEARCVPCKDACCAAMGRVQALRQGQGQSCQRRGKGARKLWFKPTECECSTK